MTHAIATMEIPAHAHAAIKAALLEAGYRHAVLEGDLLDMSGIGLVKAAPAADLAPESAA